MSQHTFKINLSGIIRVLGDNLYSTPEVYIRELLQNGVDAIRMRQHTDQEFQPCIELELKETKAPTLVFRDNGVGLTEKELHEFLATIGRSSKSEEASKDLYSDDIIGQFGIGLLSAFVVSDTIELYTCSYKSPKVVTKWVGKRDGTYTVTTAKKKMGVGTEIVLRAKKGMERLFTKEEIEKLIRLYANFLPFPIQWKGESDAPMNAQHTPVEVAHLLQEEGMAAGKTPRDMYLQFGKEQFQEEYVDAFELKTTAGKIHGIAFVLPYAVKTVGKTTVSTVYLKRMLLSNKEEQLLPEWAFFLKTVFFVDGLTPTASREGFRETEELTQAREEIGKSIIAYLQSLSSHNPQLLEGIIELHHLPFKALAVENIDFYKSFVKMLPFQTSMGRMTLNEYLEHSKEVRYTRSVFDFHQLSGVANAEGLWVINGGYVYDTDILALLPQAFPEITSTVFSPADIVPNFQDITVAERAKTKTLMEQATAALAPFDCSVAIRKFSPHPLPAIYIVDEQGNELRAFQQAQEHEGSEEHMQELLGFLNDKQTMNTNHIQLCLNYSNELIQKLATIKKKPELVQQVARLLYIQSLLQAQKPLRPIETAELNVSLLQLIEQVLNQ